MPDRPRLTVLGVPRAEAVARVQAMHETGLSLSEIARQLGVNRSTASVWLCDPNGDRQRAARGRRARPCPRCGRKMDASNGRPPRLCTVCSHAEQAGAKYWTRERIIEAIRRWAHEHGRRPFATDWRRSANGYPAFSMVYRNLGTPNAPFSTWNEAIEAAGFTPRSPGCYERTPETRARMSEAQRRRHAKAVA